MSSRWRSSVPTAKSSRPAPPARRRPRRALAVLERPEQSSGGDDLLQLLAAENVEAIDRRASGGALWAVGGPELRELMDRLAARGSRFTFAKEGGRATKHRPAWWTK